jgi:enolase
VKKIKILKVEAEDILNSVGGFSIEVAITTEKGRFSSSVPKGTSMGKHEVKDFTTTLKDAIKAVNHKVAAKLKKASITSLDSILDFEKHTEEFGGNVTIAVSFALLKALAADKGIEPWQLFKPKKKTMPLLLNKILGGGAHAGKNTPDYQEFLVMGTSNNIEENIGHNLGMHKDVKKKFQPAGKDMEGGWALEITNREAFVILKQFNKNGKIGCDFAASNLYDDYLTFYRYKDRELLNKQTQIELIERFHREFGVYYIEDPLNEEDFEGFAELTKKIGKTALIVGDDLLTTNPERLKKAISMGACNACIVKPNQIGSLSKTIEFVNLAKKNKYMTIISHRSGETNDDIIADLAVGLEIPIMKIGIVGGERVAKINRLLHISRNR